MNTRRFARTQAEAFKGPDYACAIERMSRRSDRIVLTGCAVVMVLWGLVELIF